MKCLWCARATGRADTVTCPACLAVLLAGGRVTRHHDSEEAAAPSGRPSGAVLASAPRGESPE